MDVFERRLKDFHVESDQALEQVAQDGDSTISEYT